MLSPSTHACGGRIPPWRGVGRVKGDRMPGWDRAALTARRMGMMGAGLALSLLASAAWAQPAAGFRPVTDAMIQNPDPGDWLSFRRTVNGWGYSPLDQINASNVKGLREA